MSELNIHSTLDFTDESVEIKNLKNNKSVKVTAGYMLSVLNCFNYETHKEDAQEFEKLIERLEL